MSDLTWLVGETIASVDDGPLGDVRLSLESGHWIEFPTTEAGELVITWEDDQDEGG